MNYITSVKNDVAFFNVYIHDTKKEYACTFVNGQFFIKVPYAEYQQIGYAHTTFMFAINKACYAKALAHINDNRTMRLDELSIVNYGTPNAKRIPESIVENGMQMKLLVYQINSMPWD